MDFQLTERQRELIEAAEQQFRRKLKPLTEDHSREGIQRLRKAMAEVGLLGLNMPEEQGGAGLPLLDTLLVIQKLQSCASVLGALTHRSSTGAIGAIRELGTPAQQQFVSGVCRGDFGVSIGITEPEAGSAATSMTTTRAHRRRSCGSQWAQAVRQLRRSQQLYADLLPVWNERQSCRYRSGYRAA